MSRKKGSILSEEHRKKIAIALVGNSNGLGHTKSMKVRKQISISRLARKDRIGFLNSSDTRKKMSQSRLGVEPWNKGGHFSEESKMKMSNSAKNRLATQENHPRWLGGKSFEPYTREFTKKLKLKIRERDNFTCQLCGVKEKDYFQNLSINHIDYDKSNCHESNLITLCRSCNAKVNSGRDRWTRMFKAKMLNSNTETNKS